MTTYAVIPARYASTRFPGKPLARQTGKTMIQHVYERVAECPRIDRAVVATDDERIADVVREFGGEVCLTRADHTTGTDRVGEAAAKLGAGDADLVLNVQGDEPEVHPEVLSRLVISMEASPDCPIGTVAAHFADDGPRRGPGSPLDPNCVKVVVDERGRALYFSRSAIPYPRDTGGEVDRPGRWLLHMGVYAFRSATLRSLTGGTGRERHPLEIAESLEQLRWLARGFDIAVAIVEHISVGIDTPEDYAAFVRRHEARTRAGAGVP